MNLQEYLAYCKIDHAYDIGIALILVALFYPEEKSQKLLLGLGVCVFIATRLGILITALIYKHYESCPGCK